MKNKSKINCPTFQKQELVIKDITNRINKAKEILEKVKFAEEMKEEVNLLLYCPEYNESSIDCKNCHFIANLRKNTVNLIIKTEKLDK